MKKLLLIHVLVLDLLVVSCNQPAKDSQSATQTVTTKQVSSAANQDNFIDAQMKRQGHWKIYNSESHVPGYSDNSLYEEGDYINGMKEGVWTYYAPNGEIDTHIEFKDDKPIKTY